MAKPQPTKEQSDALESMRLNEQARLYPWRGFSQQELRIMTGYGREAVSAACNSPEVPYQFQLARPEDVVAWIRKQPTKIIGKELNS